MMAGFVMAGGTSRGMRMSKRVMSGAASGEFRGADAFIDDRARWLRRLGTSVLLRAISDAGAKLTLEEHDLRRNVDFYARTALDFLFSDESIFAGWCAICGVDPSGLRYRLLKGDPDVLGRAHRAAAMIGPGTFMAIRKRHEFWKEEGA